MAEPRPDSFRNQRSRTTRTNGQLVRVALLLCSIAAAADKNNNAFRGTSTASAMLVEPPTQRVDQSDDEAPRVRTRCDPQREFHCRLENRCIPLEMRCDFQEQCLDGQDELGCPPESCTFSHNRCFWLNELTWPTTSRDNETIGTGHSNAQLYRNVLWRRYAPTLDSSPAAATMTRSSSDRNKGQITTATVGGLPGLLEQLSRSLGAGEKFIFAPMPSLPWPAGRRSANEEDKFASGPIKADSLSRPASGSQLRQRAKMQTPEIGRTSAMCQLRFEYALWPQHGDGSSPPVIMMDDGRASQAHIVRIETTLRLVAHQQLRRRRQPSESKGQEQEGETHATTRTLWSRTVDWSGQQAPDNDSATDGIGQRWVGWAVGVAELGHLELAALSFEVESLTTTTTTGGRVGENSSTAGSGVAGGGRGSATFVGSLIALKWLKFHGCHEWPRQIVQAPGVNMTLGTMEFLNEGEELTNEEEEQRGSELIDDEHEHLESPERACQPDEFMCPRSGFCLPKERLCNFVNDCMNHNDDDEDQEPASSNLAELLGLPEAEAANQQMVAAAAAGVGGEDETLDLCGSILGRERFEAARPGDKQTQLFLTSQSGRFWHLTGNWTTSQVGLRQNPQHLLHLPQADHTTRSARGTYLSLELPSPAAAAAGGAPSLYWAAIKSQWMEKLSEREFGECRLKLFYNLVSSFQLGGGGGQVGGSLLASTAGRDDNLRVSLAVEHYTLSGHLLGQLKQTGGNHLLPKLDRKLDALVRTGEPGSGDHARPLEYPGVDFWRELNLKLEGLEQGDLFLVRLVIYVELSAEATSRLRRTGERISFNLDDLSTHFGCGPVENEATLERLNQLSERHWLARDGGAFNAQDYTAAHSAPPPTQVVQTTHRPRNSLLPRIKHKWDYFWPQSPHKAASRWWWRTEDEKSTARPPTAAAASARLASSSDVDWDELDEEDERQWHRPLQQIEPQKLVACVLGAFCLIIGLIALIVFVLVPHVERAMMNYQDQIQLSLSGEYSDLPVAHSSSSASTLPGSSATTNFNNSPPVSTLGGLPSSSPFANGARRSRRLLVDPFDWDQRSSDDVAYSLDMHANGDEHSSSSSFSEFSSGVGDSDGRAPPPSDGHELVGTLPPSSSADEDFHDASDK